MKIQIAASMLMLISATAFANDTYNTNGAIFPDEKSRQGLPYAIPCKNNDFGEYKSISCTWLEFPRSIVEYDKSQGRNVSYSNQYSGRCINDRCMLSDGSAQVGNWKNNTNFKLSIWYYIAESTDGKPVAYRNDGGPYVKNGKPVSYAQAGEMLWKFYKDSGVNDKLFANTFNRRYDGGVKQFELDRSGKSQSQHQSKNIKVTEAWCNPQADDDCYINKNKVPKEKLGEYLPQVTPEQVSAAGGYCEYPICYDENDTPIGMR
ncbi:hypothetical protein Q048_01640 [Pseudomonas aeruginosa BWHPSA043]|uniref:hypothetical protein n=1 Tax=Pseudomonas TaxID=286 RepID=UPI00044BEE32|nr:MULTISPECIES: hypothetical protein [Pseudomonas]ETV31848.1 hypothetical protein Q048_01640 [Pseudomonas aeruginosa BWHPSA043]BBR56062.1 hypothetical protein WP4W18C03_43890 [Pseudomonas putida]HEH8604434.1 hypothetical protein [Pseudomonas aeruginosa]